MHFVPPPMCGIAACGTRMVMFTSYGARSGSVTMNATDQTGSVHIGEFGSMRPSISSA